MFYLSIFDLTGRLHPVLVHLPIGILLLACFFQWLTLKRRFIILYPAIPIALFWGMISAVASCISGFLLSKSDDYDMQLVSRHQWLGISVAFVSLILYFLHKRSVNDKILRWASMGLVILIFITGHLGGSLTHGSGYLSASFNKEDKKGKAIPAIPNVQEAVVYSDIVRPLLENRCYNCHGPNKQKGKLRLDAQEYILKGGKTGNTILPGAPGESELIERMLLPVNDDDHMPPKEKPQLTPNEIALLHWWISTGADFTKKVKELEQTDKIKPVLSALQSGTEGPRSLTDIPETAVKKANDTVLHKLKQAGVMVTPVMLNSNYLSASFVTANKRTDSIILLLEPLVKQLVWLNLGNTSISDKALQTVGKLTNLSRLHLNNTAVSDSGLFHLRSLARLQFVNLSATGITEKGMKQLNALKEIKSIYLYKTAVNKNAWAEIKKIFPKATIDSGGYKVPTFITDTTEIKF